MFEFHSFFYGNKYLIISFSFQGEIKLPVIMEDETHKEIPSIHHFYRPVRQMVYAILFNLHHHTYMATKSKESTSGTDSTISLHISLQYWVVVQITAGLRLYQLNRL